jgi:hypothetical protein
MHPQSLYDALVREHERDVAARAREHMLVLRRRERSLAASARRPAGRRAVRVRAAAA